MSLYQSAGSCIPNFRRSGCRSVGGCGTRHGYLTWLEMTADRVIIQLMSRKGLFMTGKKCMESLLLGVWMCGAGYGEHGPLLPRPQQIRYGTGSVAVRGTRILFSAAPNAEDRFAAEELRSWMR